jgi:hypothetical protein
VLRPQMDLLAIIILSMQYFRKLIRERVNIMNTGDENGRIGNFYLLTCTKFSWLVLAA